MKKVYIKYKILVNGLSTKNKFEIDGFELKESRFNKKIFEEKYDCNFDGVWINPASLKLYSCCTDYNDLTYNYLQTKDYLEVEVSNKIYKNIYNIFNSKKELIDDIYNFEQKLRIILNIPLLFQIINIEIYDENKKFMTMYQIQQTLSSWNRLKYNISSNEFYNNSRFWFDINYMKKTNNNFYNRALELYNNSFDSNKREIRFILIFSALEAIFNLDSEDITEKLAKYSAKILSENNKDAYESIYKDIKVLYNKRCDYIHGSKIGKILDEDEKLLRKYVRNIIIIYWHIISVTKKSASQILKYLNSEEEMDIMVRMAISTTNANSFDEQQHKAIQLVEKELGRPIPQNIKDNLLKNCK